MAQKDKTVPFEKVKILYADYILVPVSDRDASKREIQGEFHSKEQEIDYDIGLAPTEKLNTIMHEVGHGVIHTMGISLKEEEIVINSFTGGLITVFRDNRDLLKWIVSVLHPELLKEE